MGGSYRGLDDRQFLSECTWDAFRAAGPGGQKRNKTSSAVRLTHQPTGIAATSAESRSQAKNKASALRRLRHRMVLELREPVNLDALDPPAEYLAATQTRSATKHGGAMKNRGATKQGGATQHRDAMNDPDARRDHAAPAAGKLSVSPRSEGYLAVMGFVLDVLSAAGWSVSDAARSLRLSTGNLVQFLRDDEKLWAEVNRRRAERGLRTLMGE